MKNRSFLLRARFAIALTALAAATARAAALPPLPPEMQGAQPPMAHGVEAVGLAPPFGLEGDASSWPAANGEITSRAAFERDDGPVPDVRSDDGPHDNIENDNERDRGVMHSPMAAEAQPQATGALSETQSAAPPGALEGPPVPLAPAQRMSDSRRGERDANETIQDDKPITLHFRQAELPDVLEAFARFTGLNIVASEKVRGSVSLHLDAVPWRTAFDTLLDVNGLAMARRDNVIWVAPLAELAARERQRFEAHARAADLEPLASRTFALRYPRAEEVQRLLTAPGAQRVLSKRGGAMADGRTNLLFVTDLEARLVQVTELIAAIDKPSRQVLIEARIVEGARGFSRDLGTRLSLRGVGGQVANNGAVADPIGLTGGRDGVVHDLSARALAGFDAATVGLTLFAAGATRLLAAELSALEAQGRGQIVSSPRVVTADRAKATVEQGTELPYQAKVRNGVSGVQFRRATLKLEVEPQITPNGRVILDLDIAKDSIGEATSAGPAIDTKHVRTRVEVEDGGTVSIGGIYETQDRDDVTRVPLLGKIPVLGALFRHRTQREQASELAVFITPRVVEID
ncbi:MAG: type pilus assembly protein PilQ [Paraburkholderia sp.]|nr:type pilus assembly protein PilQ [Paraburkholderia sp.]MEA3122284.1 type pilus assembly protein PilQ [Paraburkholderia sp.]